MTVNVEYSDNEIKPLSNSLFEVESISASGSFGKVLHFEVLPTALIGNTYINIHYSGQKSFDKAILIEIQRGAQLSIETHTVSSLFINAEFPLDVSIHPKGGDVKNVSIEFRPPDEIDFRGKTLHFISLIEKDNPITLSSQLIIQGNEEISQEYHIPFQIIITYTDTDDNEKTEIKDFSYLLRPRSFFEFGPNGGFWLGEIFISSYVSIGTFVPSGLFITWLIKRFRKKK